ncbi:MAG TPA: hypothetical protein VN843_35555, partial [Anaerolineales bacterium]|nr:hypothetical protein [Anaerolineales bacterium]
LKHGNDKLALANLNMYVGRTFSNLAERASDSTRKAHHLTSAVTAFEEARKIYTLEHNQQDWTNVRVNLAQTYLSLENWAAAIELSSEILQAFPDDGMALRMKVAALHEGPFKFEEAFELNKKWLDRHPYDEAAQIQLAESSFTTGNFVESNRLINTFLNKTDTEVSTKSALRVIQIGCLLATEEGKEVAAKLEALIEEVETQPADFRVDWTFHGTRHFIKQHTGLEANREWLKKLFDAIENKPRDTMVKELKSLQARFKN